MISHLTPRSGRLRMLRQAFGPMSLAMAVALAFTACGGGGGGSSAATPVSTALGIGTQPANASVAVGATATFNVVASGGSTPYTYQWSKAPKGGTAAAITGATAAAYTTPALTLADDGATFTVTVKDAASASVTSNAATLTVTPPPPGALAVTMAEQSVTSGTSATFTPVVTGGKTPYTYVWKKGGTVIAGATGATYLTAVTTTADDGAQYFVSVTDSATPAATATATATLHVTNPTLTSLFNTQLSPAPAITVLLKRTDGTALGTKAIVDQRVATPGGNTLGGTVDVADGTTGHFRPKTYPIRLAGNGAVNVGDRLETLTVDQAATLTYQTSKQNWTVVLNGYAAAAVPPASFTPLTSYHVDIYQCNEGGVVAWGPTKTGFEDPRVLTASGTVTAGATTITFNTELFKGTYRAVFVPYAGADFAPGVPLLLTDPFTIQGGGVTNENQTLTLPTPSDAKRFTLKLAPRTGAPAFAANDFSVELRDKTSLLRVAYGKIKADGTVSFPTNLTDVIAAVTDLRAGPTQNKVVAVHTYTGLATNTQTTLTQYNVKGAVTAPVPIPGTAKVNISLKSGLTLPNWDRDLGSLSFPVTLATPSFDLNLFEGDWSVAADASSIPQCPDGPTVSFTLNADKTNSDIAIPQGGIITGTLQNKAGVPITTGVTVDLVDPVTTAVIKSVTANATTGKYIFYVPFGTTYNLVVDKDALVTTPLTTSAGASTATATLDLTQYSVNGRITDGALGIAAIIHAGNANNPVTASAADGTFTLKLFQGQNAVWIDPPTGNTSLGPLYFANVVVNSITAQ